MKDLSLEKIKAVVLDMDGVLVDTEPLHLESFRVLLSDLQINPDDEFLKSFVGHSVESNMNLIFQKAGIAIPEVIGTEIKRREAIYLDILKKTEIAPVSGIAELVGFCNSANLTMALATSSVREQVDVILDKLSVGLDKRLADFKKKLRVVVSGDQVLHKKPAADIYQKVMQGLGLKPDQALAVEDSPAGIRSAREAGLRCIGLQNRYWNRDQLQEARADWIIGSINELVVQLMNNHR